MAAPAWCCLGPQPPWALWWGELPLRLGAGASWCHSTESVVVARRRVTLTSSQGLRMVCGWQLGAAYLKGLCSWDGSQKLLGWPLVPSAARRAVGTGHCPCPQSASVRPACWGCGHPRDCSWEPMKLLFLLATGCVRVCGVGTWLHPARSTGLPQVTGQFSPQVSLPLPCSTGFGLGPWPGVQGTPSVWPGVSSPRWHDDGRGLGLRAASEREGHQGSLSAGSGCLLGPGTHSGLSSRSGLGLPRGPEAWEAVEADVSVACRGPSGWPTPGLTPFGFLRPWRPGQVGGGSAQGPPGPTRAGAGSVGAGVGAGRGAGGRATVFSTLGPWPVLRHPEPGTAQPLPCLQV